MDRSTPIKISDQDSINGLFLAQLIQIFEAKYKLNLDPSSEEIKEELRHLLEDLNRAKKWVDSATKQTKRALENSESGKEVTLPQLKQTKKIKFSDHILIPLKKKAKKLFDHLPR